MKFIALFSCFLTDLASVRYSRPTVTSDAVDGKGKVRPVPGHEVPDGE
jgi:hypothetical protein